MKTSLEIPDELIRDIRILAAIEGKKLKEIVAESLQNHLALKASHDGISIRDIEPVSLGRQLLDDDESDNLDEMLNERGHRY